MVLKINNLSLPLMYTPTGPVLSIERKYVDPIAWIVNSALGGDTQQFADDLSRGNDIFLQNRLYAVRPTSDDDDEEGRVQWRSLTGEELGEDIYILGTTFTHQVMLPRQTLQEILQALLKLRAEFPEPPPSPWLFRLNPYDLAPATGEEQLVRKLEERAMTAKEQPSLLAFNDSFTKLVHDLQEAGLFSENYSEEKQYWLELWGFTTLLDYHRAALAFFNHFRYHALGVQKQPTVPNYVTQNSEQPLQPTNGATPSFALSLSIRNEN